MAILVKEGGTSKRRRGGAGRRPARMTEVVAVDESGDILERDADESLSYAKNPDGTIKMLNIARMESNRLSEQWRRQQELRAMREKAGVKYPWLIPAAKRGKYHAGRCTEIYNLLTFPNSTHSPSSAAVLMGVDPTAITRWRREEPEFALAVLCGLKVQEEMLANRIAQGMPYNQGVVWVLKNLHGWKDRVENSTILSLAELVARREQTAKHVDWENPNLDAIDAPLTGAPQGEQPSAPTDPIPPASPWKDE